MVREEDIVRDEEAGTGPCSLLPFVVCAAGLNFADRRGPRRCNVKEPCRQNIILADDDLKAGCIAGKSRGKHFVRQRTRPAHIRCAH